MIFPQFNSAVNPGDHAQYTFKDAGKKLTYDEVITYLKDNPNTPILWHVPKNFLCIKIPNDLKLVPILIETKSNVFVYEHKREGAYYVICESTVVTKASKTVCGFQAEYLRGVVPLPFKLKTCTLPYLQEFSIVYDKGIKDIPDFLFPSEGKYSFITPIKGDPTDVLTLILRNLPRWTMEKRKEVLKIINKYNCEEPRTDEELEAIATRAAETNIEDFFDGSTFKHDAMGEYLIKLLHIKKDAATGELYYYDSVKQIYDNNPDYLQGFITKNYSGLKDHQRREVINFINFYLYEDSVNMNTNPYSIVFNNGVLDIRTLKLEPMNHRKLESIKIEHNYTPYAYSEIVDEFFETLSCKDKEIEQLFYEAIGYSLLKTSELQISFTLVGSGRNGKSTYLDLIKKILGRKNFTSISYKDLANNFRASDLIGKLASIAGDISSQPLSDSDLYKSIVAGEEIMLEKKFKDAKALNLFATLFFSCNKIPRTPDTTEGFLRRQVFIPCEADLSSVSKVDGMKFKENLLSEEAVEYVIYKSVQAIHDTLKRGDFTKSARVEALKQKYKEDNSPVLAWIKDTYGSPGVVAKMTFKNAWKSYKLWAQESERKMLNQTNFKNELKANGLELED